MRRLKPTTAFRRDVKRCRKRGLPMQRLADMLTLLQQDAALPAKARPHRLSGAYASYRKCHIAPDWLLIYAPSDDGEVLFVYRTGTHADLFR